MIILKIIGIILASLVLLIGLILAVRVDVILHAGDDGFRLGVGIFGIRLGGKKKPDKAEKKPKKKKTEERKKQEKKKNPIVSKVLDMLGLSQVENLEETWKSIGKDGVTATIGDTVDAVLLILQRVYRTLTHCKVRKLDLRYISAGEDAADVAMTYGTACAVLYPLLGYATSEMRVNPKKMNVDIGCDFESEKSKFEFDTVISLRVFHAVSSVVIIVVKNIIKSLGKKEEEECLKTA